jgi:small subunit ribosomal protein S17
MARTIVGIVSSDKNDKTIVVTVSTRKTHPLYRKQYSSSRKFMVHDEKNEAQVGDKVAIVETKPLSARKRYALERIIEKPVLREDTLAITKDETEEATLEARDHKRDDEEDATEEASE